MTRCWKVRGVDALCHEPEKVIHVDTPEEAAEIFMAESKECLSSLDTYEVEVCLLGTWQRYTLVGEVSWSAEEESSHEVEPHGRMKS